MAFERPFQCDLLAYTFTSELVSTSALDLHLIIWLLWARNAQNSDISMKPVICETSVYLRSVVCDLPQCYSRAAISILHEQFSAREIEESRCQEECEEREMTWVVPSLSS